MKWTFLRPKLKKFSTSFIVFRNLFVHHLSFLFEFYQRMLFSLPKCKKTGGF